MKLIEWLFGKKVVEEADDFEVEEPAKPSRLCVYCGTPAAGHKDGKCVSCGAPLPEKVITMLIDESRPIEPYYEMPSLPAYGAMSLSSCSASVLMSMCCTTDGRY